MVKALLALWLFVVPAAADPVKVEVRPPMAMAPTTISITVQVEPKETNRGLVVVISSDNYYRSSFDPDFVGMDSPLIRRYQYELRAPGHYVIAAVLKRALPDKDETATTPLCLIGTDVEC